MQTNTICLVNTHELLKHWQGHRNLTRRVLEAFPEDQFSAFSVAGMRTPAQLAAELLAIAGPGITSIATNVIKPFSEEEFLCTEKQACLQKWDETTKVIDDTWDKLSEHDFHRTINLFMQYEFPAISSIFYFIDNEIHHRGQLYVYLRALGIEPPFFWERF